AEEELKVGEMELVGYAHRIRQCLKELSDVQALADSISGRLCIKHPAAKAVKAGRIHGIIHLFLDGELFVILVERTLLGGHKPGSHCSAIGTQRNGSRETSSVCNASCCDDGNINRIRNARYK